MKKRLTCILVALSAALALCSCIVSDSPESAEPQSVPDVESIVEPVTESESSVEADLEPESKTAYPGSMDAPVPVVSHEPEPVISDVAPVDLAEAQPIAAAEISEPELLEALAPDILIDSVVIEKELLRLINDLRDEVGVSALGIEDSLQLAARIRAAEAFESFSHTRPNGAPYNTAFDEAGFSYAGKWHGENLASLSLSSGSMKEEEIALKMFDGLKNSPGHYRNMTEKNFVQVGVGVAVTYTEDNVDITSAQMFSGL